MWLFLMGLKRLFLGALFRNSTNKTNIKNLSSIDSKVRSHTLLSKNSESHSFTMSQIAGSEQAISRARAQQRARAAARAVRAPGGCSKCAERARRVAEARKRRLAANAAAANKTN